MRAARALVVTTTGTLRAPWRLLLFLAAAAVLVPVGSVLVDTLVVAPLGALGVTVVAWPLALSVALLAAHWAMLSWVERRPWGAVGMGRSALAPRPLAGAFVLGALTIGLPSLALAAAGLLQVEAQPDGPWWSTAARALAYLLPAALWEELLFRGYPFAVVREAAGTWAALVAGGLLFGLLHLQNAGAGARSTALVSAAGVLLGLVLVRTGSLYAAWAAHVAWNWTLAGLLHVAVSGSPFPTPDYRLVDAGPDWATGGAWGPEGGLAAAVGIGVAMLFIFARPLGRRES